MYHRFQRRYQPNSKVYTYVLGFIVRLGRVGINKPVVDKSKMDFDCKQDIIKVVLNTA